MGSKEAKSAKKKYKRTRLSYDRMKERDQWLRQMFSKHHQGERTFKEIGKDLGISAQMAQHIYRRAMGKLWMFVEDQAKKAGCTPIEWMKGDY